MNTLDLKELARIIRDVRRDEAAALERRQHGEGADAEFAERLVRRLQGAGWVIHAPMDSLQPRP